ncbi:hypothetical protein ANN_10802 [Periplaneta americana]|uniref:Uncharacterized protein n=1 Tax=Periplaneta americana TaxID=6978 RepID=A0ABQ8T3B2_PERAM|nr:hypothetical protein ANN_10802 [Periplaneta americana]
MSPGSNTESYPVLAHIGLRENPRKNLNQVTCPDRESNPGHLVSLLDALTVTPQINRHPSPRKSKLSVEVIKLLQVPAASANNSTAQLEPQDEDDSSASGSDTSGHTTDASDF